MRDIDINVMNKCHLERQKLWHAGAKPWTVADHGNALAGEAGELVDPMLALFAVLGAAGRISNKIKKIRRIELGHTGSQLRNQTDTAGPLIDDIAGEMGGLFIYMLNLANHLGINLTDAIRDEFNRVSKEQGFDVFMPSAAEHRNNSALLKAARAMRPVGTSDEAGGTVIITLEAWNAVQHALLDG